MRGFVRSSSRCPVCGLPFRHRIGQDFITVVVAAIMRMPLWAQTVIVSCMIMPEWSWSSP
ncbi:DUF983 domain-containing protein [Fuerstiella marisgermanici]|uniref:DUF983 domain-containing protein n=1 Tax=Fuerstiella marisgermanici TaxID=1891926 RepID=UPI0039C8B15E